MFFSTTYFPDCMVVGFTPREEGQAYILSFKKKKPYWRMVSLDFGSAGPYSFRFPTLNGRHLYGLCDGGELYVFEDLGDENYCQGKVVAEAPRSCCKTPTQHFLVKCGTDLLQVIVGEFGESVEVFKLNYSTNECEKIDDLGKHMIYVRDKTCSCIEAKSLKWKNKIYFPRLYNGNGKIVFSSLETRRYHTFSDNHVEGNFGDFLGTTHHLNPHIWIEPNWS